MFRKLLTLLTLVIIATMILSACNLISAPDDATENEIAMAITMTISAMELEAVQTELAEAQQATAAEEEAAEPTEEPSENTAGDGSAT